jgi:uncharacterized membrane protein YjjP (DUF1212 family)
MSMQTSNTDLLKKADRVADLSFWLFIVMAGLVLVALIFQIPLAVVNTAFFALTLVGWLIKIVESRLLRRALKQEGSPRTA